MLSANISFMSTNFPVRILSTNFRGKTSPAGESRSPALEEVAELAGDWTADKLGCGKGEGHVPVDQLTTVEVGWITATDAIEPAGGRLPRPSEGVEDEVDAKAGMETKHVHECDMHITYMSGRGGGGKEIMSSYGKKK